MWLKLYDRKEKTEVLAIHILDKKILVKRDSKEWYSLLMMNDYVSYKI